MAKKRRTKEGKIIAQLRRELQEVKRELKQLKQEKEPEAKPKKDIPSFHLKRDLTKSLILSILAIGIEVVIYWFILPDGKFRIFKERG